MKKTIVLAFVLAAISGLLVAGVAFAQDENPPFGDRGPRDGTGLLHEYMSEAMAKALGLTAGELETRHAAGETFYDIATEKYLTADEIRTLMQDARTSALEAAVADGVLTQEQVDQMQARGGSRGGKNGGPGMGVCDGSGQFEGSGSRGGGRGQGRNLTTTTP